MAKASSGGNTGGSGTGTNTNSTPNSGGYIGYSNWTQANREVEKHLEKLERIATIQTDLNKSTSSYIDGIKQYSELTKKISKLEKERGNRLTEIKNKLDEIESSGLIDKKQRDKIEARLIKEYEDELKFLKQQSDEIKKQIKLTTALSVAAKDIGKSIIKTIGDLPNLIQRGYGQIKSSGLFEMDGAIRASAFSMGILGKQSQSFKNTVLLSAQGTGKLDGLAAELGVSVQDIAKNQADYSDELGRAVMLGDEGNRAIAEMAKGTLLGAEGASKMAAELDNFGLSAESTAKFMKDALDDAGSYGLNTGKVTKNIQQNIKMLNKYNFKEGINGLEKMAKTAARLGIEMSAIEPMADKLFDVEGAVEMSAQLQVLGGAFSSLADPFKLMFMARNDVDGLTESLANAAAESMHLANDGSIQMTSLEMARLKKVAESTGVAYDDIVKSGKNIAKFKIIEPQLKFNADDKEKEFLENVAQLDEKGRAFIEIGLGSDGNIIKKYIDQLGSTGRDVIKQQMDAKASLADRAKAAMNFDDKLTSVIMGIKTDLYPIVDIMDKNLIPSLNKFVQNFVKDKWGEKIGEFATVVGNLASGIGRFMFEQPIWFAALVGGGKLFSFLFEKAAWILNGISLGTGFNSTVAAGGATGGIASMAKDFASAAGPLLGTAVGTVGAGLISGAIGIQLGKAVSNFLGKKDTSTGDALGVGLGAAGGIAGGMLLGASIGNVLPGFGTVIGAGIGALAGGLIGKGTGDFFATPEGYDPNEPTSIKDGIVKFHPNDKFMKVNDSTMIAGTNMNGNKDLANSIQGMMGSSNNYNYNNSTSNQNTTINFGKLEVTGTIRVEMGNYVNEQVGKNLINSPEFTRLITQNINVQMSKNRNGNKTS